MLRACLRPLVPLAFLIALVVPPTLVAADAPPKGDVTRYTFDKSAIFPGTTRSYWIYVPKQYDPAKPACLYVNQDNVQFKAPEVFDALIASGEMPVTIGVFASPGVVKAARPDAADRVNRSFEYDSLGDAYARFLLDELLPEVETRTAPDGRPIKLSKDPNDRGIGGSSSGAICAFTVAWERPDAFRRIFSSIGTFVGLRGGNEYQTLIRKYEPKPLRIFLQDGSGDLNNPFGDWWMTNQAMERALIFAGYEVNHVWGDGGHNGVQATAIFADAQRWLWKGWPEPIEAGKGSPVMANLLIPGEDWKLVGEGYGFTEGPTANAQGEVFFDDIPRSKSYKVDLDGNLTPFQTDTKKANGQAFGPDGKMYTIATATAQILCYDGSGEPKVIAEGVKGNDIVVLADGSIYATAPGARPTSELVYISPTGEKKVVDTGLKYANGVSVSPDQGMLYASDSQSHWVYSYQIQPDGTLKDKQKYYRLHTLDTADDTSADGIRCDRQGMLYVATRSGLQICDKEGRVAAIVPTPTGSASNLCFGGKDFDTIYATAGSKVFKRKVKAQGAMPFLPPIKPPAPRG